MPGLLTGNTSPWQDGIPMRPSLDLGDVALWAHMMEEDGVSIRSIVGAGMIRDLFGCSTLVFAGALSRARMKGLAPPARDDDRGASEEVTGVRGGSRVPRSPST